jgi:outer membrane receptor protein involved in Fe transport
LLSGFVHNYFVGPALGFSHTRNYETGYFAQDDWRVNRRLTLNLGLRYDLYTWPYETHNLQANFDLATGQLVLPGTNGYPKSLINTDTNNFAPRIGFAYSATSDGKTVIRGGYGIFYFLDRGGIDNQLAQNPPFSGEAQFKYEDGFRFNLGGAAPNSPPGSNPNPTNVNPNGLPGKGPLNVNLAAPTNVNVIAYPKNDVNSYAQQYNLQFQHELSNNTSLSLAYVGTRGVNLMSLFQSNRQEYNTPSGTFPYPGLGNVNTNITNGTSHYNGLQVDLQRRLSSGVQFNAAYSWSHTIDDSPGTLDNQSDYIDLFNFRHERANSLLDIRHRFVLNSILELPFGRGKMWGGNFNGFEQAIAGGWQILPILTLQSGMPFDIFDKKNSPHTRPNLVGPLRQLNGIANTSANNTWFDTTAFVDPPSAGGVYLAPGNTPRDPFNGPARKFLDLTVTKNFKITERVNTEFRSAFYNITNSPQFSAPTGDLNDGNFGRVKSIILSSERQIEFALRFSF